MGRRDHDNEEDREAREDVKTIFTWKFLLRDLSLLAGPIFMAGMYFGNIKQLGAQVQQQDAEIERLKQVDAELRATLGRDIGDGRVQQAVIETMNKRIDECCPYRRGR